ncbi:MAG TPA: hypothetical protein VK177_07090 [Flavobacteriales bacterium]|nr:hypothetical protein [Flavobacteriales bacterium]
MKAFIYLSISVTFLASSCGKPGLAVTGDERFHEYPSELSAREFAEWKKNETQLLSQKKTEDITFTICYQPAEWLALKSLGKSASSELVNRETSNYQDLMYFTLRMQLNTEQTELLKFRCTGSHNYQERVNYYSFKVQNDIGLVIDSKDTLPCSISHFERAYTITNYTDIMLGFSMKELNKLAPEWKTVTVLFNDRIFENAIIPFSFERKQLSNTPKVKVS